METVKYFLFLGSIITADDDGSHEIKKKTLASRKEIVKSCYKVKVTQSCLILCDLMDCNLSGSSIRGIL